MIVWEQESVNNTIMSEWKNVYPRDGLVLSGNFFLVLCLTQFLSPSESNPFFYLHRIKFIIKRILTAEMSQTAIWSFEVFVCYDN